MPGYVAFLLPFKFRSVNNAIARKHTISFRMASLMVDLTYCSGPAEEAHIPTRFTHYVSELTKEGQEFSQADHELIHQSHLRLHETQTLVLGSPWDNPESYEGSTLGVALRRVAQIW